MGTASYSVTNPAKIRGRGAPATLSTDIVTSGAHTTTTAASDLTDAAGVVTLASGQYLTVHADEAMRMAFAGTAATASTGIYIPADQAITVECDNPGPVSIIDVA